MRSGFCPEMRRDEKRQENILCAYSHYDPSSFSQECSLKEERESGDVKCGKDLYEYMKENLSSDKLFKRAFIYLEDELFRTFKTGFFSGELAARDILDRSEDVSGRVVDNSVIRDLQFEPADDRCVFSASESKYACWIDVFAKRLRPVAVEAGCQELLNNPLLHMTALTENRIWAGQLVHEFAGGEVPEKMLDGAEYSEFRLLGTSDRSNCENSWKIDWRIGDETYPIRATIDSLNYLSDSNEVVVLEHKSSLSRLFATYDHQRQSGFYQVVGERAVNSQIPGAKESARGKAFIVYLRRSKGSGFGWTGAVTHIDKIMKDFNGLALQSINNIPEVVDGNLELLVDSVPSTCGKSDFGCYAGRFGLCNKENLQDLVRGIRESDIPQDRWESLKFATVIER